MGDTPEDPYKCIISDAFLKKLYTLLQYYIDHPNEFKPTSKYHSLDEAYNWAKTRITSSFFAQYGRDAFYLAGAPMKLALDGVIEMAPAETQVANRSAMLVAKSDVYKSRAVMDDREDIAVELAASDETGDKKTRLIVFGAKHAFADNVVRFNKSHPDQQVGLITIRDKE